MVFSGIGSNRIPNEQCAQLLLSVPERAIIVLNSREQLLLCSAPQAALEQQTALEHLSRIRPFERVSIGTRV